MDASRPCSAETRRRRRRRPRRTLAAAAIVLAGAVAGTGLAAPAHAVAPPRTASFSADDYCLGQCADILPPGANGSATLAEILSNQAFGSQPAHADDTRDLYANLALGYPGLTDETIDRFFADASFDVAPADVETVVTPRSDVTITRDKRTGVPHIRGTTRYGTEYGAGWAAAQDRLWLMDVLRHVGRGELTEFAGGAAGNRALEQQFFKEAPYTEADLQNQIDRAVAGGGARGTQALADVRAYLDGVNAYITQARANRNFPGEYVLAGKIDSITNAGTIAPFTVTDVAAIASVIGALFGSGGGSEVKAALALQAAQAKYGTALGTQVWRAFEARNDPEAVTTIQGTSFPYALTPAGATGVAMPDAGSVQPVQLVHDATGSAASAATSSPASSVVAAEALASAQGGMSNALVVSGAHTASGHPVAVFGPQTGYFAPQLLMLQDVQGPGISARGVSFAGLSFYVQLGRGQDYAWSATSPGQDITDVYVVTLCEPSGATPTRNSTSYLFRGTCTPMERITRENSWTPTTADGTAAGSYTLVMYRTKYGLVHHTGTVGGAPVAFTSLRSTYQHEVDSIVGFQKFNDPGFVTDATTFQQAAADVAYTFNWFYVDSRQTAYVNSGLNPVRPATVDPSLPIVAAPANEWVNWDPATNTPAYTPAAQHPNSINQPYYTNWNNKLAPDHAAPAFGDGSVHRGNLIESLVGDAVRAGTPITRTSLTQLMMQAGLTDLRGKDVLPELLAVIDTGTVPDAATSTAVGQLHAWLNAGALRTETASGSHAYTHPDAIRIMDAWWPLLVKGIFETGMGSDFYSRMTSALQIDEAPNGVPAGGTGSASDTQGHKGSAFQYGWYSYVDKDLRRVLGRPVSGAPPVTYCGGGSLADCRSILLSTLRTAAATPAATVYPADAHCSAGDQWCADSLVHSPLGGIKHNTIGWQNRPTYQQVVEFPAARGDTVTNLAAGRTATASSVQSSSYPAARAVDGSGTTRWASQSSDAQWLQVDLGSARQVARAVLRWEAAYGKGYTISVSDNGSAWRTVATVTAGNGGVDNVTFPATTARYVRFTGQTRGTGYGYSLYELEVYAR